MKIDQVTRNIVTSSGKFEEVKKYWLDKLQGEFHMTGFPVDYRRINLDQYSRSTISCQLPAKISKKLTYMSNDSSYALYVILLSGVKYLLSRYTANEDIIVGMPIVKKSVDAKYVNDVVALRTELNYDEDFKKYLVQVRNVVSEGLKNQNFPLSILVEMLNVEPVDHSFPLVNTIVMLEGLHDRNSIEDIKADIIFDFSKGEEGIQINLEYNSHIFRIETVNQILKHLEKYYDTVINQPGIKLSEIQLLPEEEQKRILFDFNDTTIEYPNDRTLYQLFEEQVEKTPDNIALMYEEKQLTYRELNEKANQLARVLQKKGVKNGTFVGLLVERSLEMIICIFGILKTGGAYLPLDPAYPKGRIMDILNDSEAPFLMVQKSLSESCELEHSWEVMFIEDLFSKLKEESGENLNVRGLPNDLVYVMYTSGSTGKPKGNLTKHFSVTRVVKNTNYIDIVEDDVILQLSNYAFDGSAFDIFGALLNGAKLILFNQKNLLDMYNLSSLIKNERITVFFTTTALFNTLVDVNIECFKNIRKVLFGGERVSVHHVKKALEYIGKDKILHMYGPTESTVYTTFYPVNEINEKWETVPIGKPLANTKVYILDQNQNLQMIGVAGELYISGDGLADGYLKRPELTREKFISYPFKSGEIMYKTGDLARWLPDGNIEFIDRIDSQVKIRGFRIELGEIEQCLLKHEHVQEVIVVAQQEFKGSKYLCAYVVSDHELNRAELKKYLSSNLPEYMIPAYFVQLERLPLNPNGKIDKKALPQPKTSMMKTTRYEEPRNEAEKKLQEIWRGILGIERIGINDNFFELGGHSLKATILTTRIHKTFNVDLKLRDIFKAPTIKTLAESIENAEENIYSSIEVSKEREYYPLSSAQKRVFVLQQFEGADITYNIPVAMLIEGILDYQRLEETFKKLIKRYDSLRTSFELIDGEPIQKIVQAVDFKVNYIEADESRIKEIIRDFIRPFDLSKAPLFRVQVVKLGDQRELLLMDMHHIASDGTSMAILFREFTDLYQGKDLPELRIQYKDFSEWQINLFKCEEIIKEQRMFWLNTFSGELPVLNLPLDYPRPAMQSFEGNRVNRMLDQEIIEKLYNIAAITGTTLYMILMASYNVLLSKYTGQEDIIVGSPIAGRPHADLENLIGMFVNTLAHRNNVQQEMTFREFLDSVKENTLRAFENQDYPFEELVEKLEIKKDLSRNPLFDTMFNLQNVDFEVIEIDDMKFIPYDFDFKTAKFDLNFSVLDQKDGLKFEIEYCTKLFKDETVERMLEHFINIIRFVTENVDIKISDIEIMSKEEKKQVLIDFNDTTVLFPEESLIFDFFERQVEKTPDNIAVIFEDKKLTYRELNEKANQLARRLREDGVKPDQVVAIMVERSLEMMIGLMAILKAGGAYLPIAPNYPIERIDFMLKDSAVNLILTQYRYMEKANHGIKVIDLEDENLYQGDGSNLERLTTSRNLVYVIYTSGSTGKPKGVMVEHRSVLNRLYWGQKTYSIDEKDTVMQKTPYTFDVSVWELFWWSFNGAKVCFLTPGGEKDPEIIAEVVQKNNVTIIHFVPSMMNVFLEYIENNPTNMDRLATIRSVFVSGEALNVNQIEQFNQLMNKNFGATLHNLYGPTEASIEVTYYDCPTDKHLYSVPIGKPIDNVRTYIVSKNNRLKPIGIPGELCIAGDCLARGYQNRPEFTEEKFVDNPFEPGAKMYRTGDLVKWNYDGEIEFLGRIDYQVKIRGYRIELGEIENQLLRYPEVTKAVVVDQTDTNGMKYLCAYIVSEKEVTVTELRDSLAKELPEYMIPAFFVRLDDMPMTSSGKIDRKALPKPEGNICTTQDYVGPQTQLQKKLVKIWQDVLGIERVGITDNFMALGGDSIKAIQITSQLKKLNLKIGLKEIFKYKTIDEVSKNVKLDTREADQGTVEKEVMLTPIQRWFMERNFTGKYHWNQSFMLYREEGFDEDAVRESFTKIIEHHDALRMNYRFEEEEVIQFNRGLNEGIFDLTVIDIDDDINYEKQIEE